VTTLQIAPTPAAPDPRDPEDRLQRFFDPGSMSLLMPRDTSGVMAARGTVSGTPAIAYCTDATVMGGAMGVDGCRHIVDAIDTSLRERVASVGIWHSGGARLAEGVTALHAVGEVFAAMVRASGRIPQISVVLGPAAGGAAYGPALTDLVIMGPAGRVFVTGPDVVRSVTGEDVDMESLGGPDTHGRRSGVVHVVTDSEQAALETARMAVDLLAAQGTFDPSADEPDVDLGALLPEQKQRAYDVKPLIANVLDGPGLELHPRFAQSELRGYHAQHGIATEAWSPIGQGQGLLDDPVLADLATKYGKTPAQIVLRRHVQLDNIVFPKSMHAERMRENIDVFDFELSPEDEQAVSALDAGDRLGPDPDRFG